MPADAGIQPYCDPSVKKALDSRFRGNAVFVPGGDDIRSEWDCVFLPAERWAGGLSCPRTRASSRTVIPR